MAVVPTITKTHAPCNAYWMVALDEKNGAASQSQRKYVKRPLDLKDMFLAQGWPASAAKKFEKSIGDKDLKAALGNAMPLNAMKGLWKSVKPLLEVVDKVDIDVSAK